MWRKTNKKIKWIKPKFFVLNKKSLINFFEFWKKQFVSGRWNRNGVIPIYTIVFFNWYKLHQYRKFSSIHLRNLYLFCLMFSISLRLLQLTLKQSNLFITNICFASFFRTNKQKNCAKKIIYKQIKLENANAANQRI